VHVKSGKGFYQISGNLPRSLRHFVHDASNANTLYNLKEQATTTTTTTTPAERSRDFELQNRLAKLCPQ